MLAPVEILGVASAHLDQEVQVEMLGVLPPEEALGELQMVGTLEGLQMVGTLEGLLPDRHNAKIKGGWRRARRSDVQVGRAAGIVQLLLSTPLI